MCKGGRLTELDGVGGEVVGDGVLDDTEELLRALNTTNRQLVQELDCTVSLLSPV